MNNSAELSAQNLARTCAMCGDPASVFRIGSEAEYRPKTTMIRGGLRTVQVLTQIAIPSVDLCLAHGLARWPWRSHRVGRKRA